MVPLTTRLFTINVVVFFLVAILFHSLFPGNDPYRCRAILETGRWVDPNQEGTQHTLRQWQPDGCMMKSYASADIRRCMEGRRITVVGDSAARDVALVFAQILDPKQFKNDNGNRKYPKTKAFNITYHGQMVEYLPSLGIPPQESLPHSLEQYADEKMNHSSIEDHHGPALIYIAGDPYTNGTAPSHHRPNTYKDHLSHLSALISEKTPDLDPFSAPMDPYDGIGNQIFYAPPAAPDYEKLNTSEQKQQWLENVQEQWDLPILWSASRLAFGQPEGPNISESTHLGNRAVVADRQAQILLNMRCNAKLDRILPYAYERTCCSDYGAKPAVQRGLVAFGIIYLMACVFGEIRDLLAGRDKPQWILFNMKAGCFVLSLLMCHYADRTQIMAKGKKIWLRRDFMALSAACLAILLLTVRRSKSLRPRNLSLVEKVNDDQPFLSRHQTEEWKGWMQCVIVINHWTGAPGGSVVILVRLCVASFIFLTGYGHTLYFLERNDYSFRRVGATLLRLNLLSSSLAFFMDTDSIFYYFSPLVSFWFLVVYFTMRVGAKKYNTDPQFVLAKICISCAIVSTIFSKTSFTRWLFNLLNLIFNTQGSAATWQYRVTLDIYIPYAGMVAAVVCREMRQTRVSLLLRVVIGLGGMFAIYHYLTATSTFDGERYKKWHTHIAIIPLLGFVALRNISASLRNYHSTAMAWLGRCSLEIYLLQFHLLLAADWKGIMVVDGLFGDGSLIGDRWRTLAILVPVLVWISGVTATSTTYIVNLVMHETPGDMRLGHIVFGSRWKSLQPKIRLACLLLGMWLLNLLFPGHTMPHVPGGGNSIH